jgi:hypothetical protein
MTPVTVAIPAFANNEPLFYRTIPRDGHLEVGQTSLAQVLLESWSVEHRNSELEHGLLTLRSESQAPASNIVEGGDSIHLLCVDIHDLSDAQRAAFQISSDELLDWLGHASEQSRSLVVVLTKSAFMFYTTEHDRRVTLRPVLATLAKRVRELPDLGNIRTIEQTGVTVARQLLTYAVDSAAHGIANKTSEIHDAIELSTASSTLGPTLASLFRAATDVERRVRQETMLNDPHTCASLREVESFAAERIVEEELAIWQSLEAEFNRASDPVPPTSRRYALPFESREPASEVRLRAAHSINPRISFLPDPKQSVS